MHPIVVNIYGFEGEQTLSLQHLLTEIFAEGYELSINQIEDVDTMLKKKIGHIPALSINGVIHQLAQIPTRLDIEKWAYPHLYNQSKSDAMKKILVPVDFSDTSKNAYQFALAYAKKTGATIKLTHVYHSPLDVSNPAVLVNISDQEASINQALQKMVGESPNVTYEAKLGFAVEEILQYSESDDIDLIIMGTMGEHMTIEKIFGTVSSDISQKASCPVLLIPPNTVFTHFDDILFASDYSATKGQVLDKILSFSKAFSAAIHFVHVNDKTDALHISPEELIFDKVFDRKDPESALYFSEITDTSVTHGLNKYIEDHHPQLVVLVAEKRNFWERIFHKSITKEMALNTNIPMMILHV